MAVNFSLMTLAITILGLSGLGRRPVQAEEVAVEQPGRGLQDRRFQELEKRLDDAERHIVALAEELNGTTNCLSLLEKAAKPKVSFTAALGDAVAAPKDKPLRLVFGVVLNNVGADYDAKKGIFRAPGKGIYHIGFILTTQRLENVWRPCYASIMKNGHGLVSSFVFTESTPVASTQNHGTSLVVLLEAGDQVWVDLWPGSFAYDKPDYQLSTFTGFLVDAL